MYVLGNRKVAELYKGTKRFYAVDEGSILPLGFKLLSYFNKMDIANKTDHPIIGNQVDFSEIPQCSYSSLIYNNYIYPCVYLYDSVDNSRFVKLSDAINVGKKTIEFIISFPSATPYSYFGSDASASCRNSYHALWAADSIVTWTSLTKTLSWNGYGSYRIYIPQTTPIHYAFEYNFDTNTCDVFVNGTKVMSIQYNNDWDKEFWANPYKGLYLSQLAVREGLFSTEGVFPAPTKPYFDNGCLKLGYEG